MSLLNQIFGSGGDDPRSQAMGLLSAGLMRGDAAGGLLGANQAFAQAPTRLLQKQLLQSQVTENEAQARERAIKTQREQVALEQAARLRQELPGLFQGGGSGGAPGAPGGGSFDWMRAVQMGMDPKMAQEYAALQNIGRAEVARTQEVDDGKGGKMVVQLDKFGMPVGSGMAGYTAPVQVNQGSQISFVKPTAGASLPVGMSPSERDASARGWAGNSLAAQRLAFDQQNQGASKVPAGYRMNPDGSMAAIPGGPADLRAGAEGQKRTTDAKDVLGLLDEADKLLPKATGGYLGAGVDQAARLFGSSTKGAEASAQLKALQGALVSKMPKMSGPQSDKDVQLYREMAGQIGDSTLPIATRQAASVTIRALNEKYAGMEPGSSKQSEQQAPQATLRWNPKTGKLEAVR